MSYLFLTGAVLFEVLGTIALRLASSGSGKRWYIGVAAGYLAAFTFLTLTLTLTSGLGLGIAYGIWAASGVALTAIASTFLFKEPLTLLMTGGIA